jgi:hypothetical protein
MRTCVLMTPRPYRPRVELDGALQRGELRFAMTLASEVADERRRPIDLDLAVRFLPPVALQQPEQYDAWALRWLGRWINETPGATIARAADIAASLADLQTEPSAFEALRSQVNDG